MCNIEAEIETTKDSLLRVINEIAVLKNRLNSLKPNSESLSELSQIQSEFSVLTAIGRSMELKLSLLRFCKVEGVSL